MPAFLIPIATVLFRILTGGAILKFLFGIFLAVVTIFTAKEVTENVIFNIILDPLFKNINSAFAGHAEMMKYIIYQMHLFDLVITFFTGYIFGRLEKPIIGSLTKTLEKLA